MKATLFTLAFIALTYPVFSQNLEFGYLGGVAFYNGDIDVELQGALHSIRPANGIYARYFLNERIVVRGQALFAQIEANEKRFPTQEWRGQRGYSFKTTLFEASILPELRVLKIWDFEFYGFGGIGAAFYDAMNDYNLEGDNAKALAETVKKEMDNRATFSFVMPIGGGVQWNINNRFALGGEISGRKTFSDGFDGIRFSGGNSNDFYFTANLTLSTFLDGRVSQRSKWGSKGRRSQRRHRHACPYF